MWLVPAAVLGTQTALFSILKLYILAWVEGKSDRRTAEHFTLYDQNSSKVVATEFFLRK
jgi:hypothetical protein